MKPFQTSKLGRLSAQLKKLRRFAPEEAITFIEKEMGLQDYIKKQGNEGNKLERSSDDVRDLKIAARGICQLKVLSNIPIIWWPNTTKQKKAPVNENSIQLMTIHRAKGLEFDAVYIAGAVEGNLPHDYALDAWRKGDDKPIEEERRLMYVAMTRARKSLAISVPMMRRDKRAQRSRFVREWNRTPIVQS